MERQTQPAVLTGALAGLLLAALLQAVLFAAAQLFGTAFVPFDLFDWIARVLPGPIITFGIDSIVAIIRGLGAQDLSGTAKAAEQVMAVGILLVIGAAAGALVFALLRPRGRASLLAGLFVGLVIGLPLTLLSAAQNTSATASAGVSLVLNAAAFLAWGAGLVWAFNRLMAAAPAAAATNSVTALNRRQFVIQVGGATAAFTVLGGLVGALTAPREETAAPSADGAPIRATWSAQNDLPNAADPLIAAPGTRPELTPLQDHYRIDINLQPPVVEESNWKLTISGLVDNPLELTLDQIRSSYTPMHQFVTLSCISNPIAGSLIGTQRWTGVSLQTILDEARLQPNAAYLHIKAADGFDEVLDIASVRQDERIMLAYAWDDLPLSPAHGFPLRIYIPGLYGMKQPKWITSIEAISEWREGYWVRRGWDEVARVNTTTVIDTIAVSDLIEEGGVKLVPIGGIAYSGKRGIAKVEVKVDEGEWVEARLRAPISDTTWVIWRYDWPFTEGQHTFAVRAVDGDGTRQVEERRDARPSGATGLHIRRQTL
jgi:DMSO/TMAO reductase YedYZ molybdopterin-dependent catalytic subunit